MLNCNSRDASTSQNAFSEECVLNGENTESQRTPPQTPPTPAPRFNPPPENIRTHAYPPPDLPPCGHTFMSISAISDQGVIYAMTHEAGDCYCTLICKLSLSSSNMMWKFIFSCCLQCASLIVCGNAFSSTLKLSPGRRTTTGRVF